MIKLRFALSFLSVLTLASVAGGTSALAEVLGDFGDWTAVQGDEGGNALCYMSSEPTKDEGNYTQRGKIYAIVTHRPAEKSLGVVTFQAGYPLKSDAAVSVSIDGKPSFSLFGKDEFAWTRNAGDDAALVKAMRAGSTMVVKGTSARGTATTDTYSLSGFTAALNAINTACGLR